MTNLADARVIVLADYRPRQRQRVRRFWGAMGVVLRFEDRRVATTEANHGADVPATRKTAFETRAPRGR